MMSLRYVLNFCSQPPVKGAGAGLHASPIYPGVAKNKITSEVDKIATKQAFRLNLALHAHTIPLFIYQMQSELVEIGKL
jgi:hypothetical protein